MQRRSPRGRFWGIASIAALALLGLVVAAAISLAASRLSSQHIGISSEPLSAGRSLSPVDDGQSQKKSQRQTRTRNHHSGSWSTQTQTSPMPPPRLTPTPPATSTPPSGDDSGGDHSGGRGGRGGEDD